MAWTEYEDKFVGVFSSEELAQRALRESCSCDTRNNGHRSQYYCHIEGPYILDSPVH